MLPRSLAKSSNSSSLWISSFGLSSFATKSLRAGAEAIRLAIFIPSIKVLLSFSSARKFPFIAGWSSAFDDLICIDPLDSGLSWQGEIVIPGCLSRIRFFTSKKLA